MFEPEIGGGTLGEVGKLGRNIRFEQRETSTGAPISRVQQLQPLLVSPDEDSGQHLLGRTEKDYVVEVAFGAVVNSRSSERKEVVTDTARGVVEEVFEDKANIVLDLYGEKKVYGLPLEVLERNGIASPKRGDPIILQAILRNGRTEGRLVRLSKTPETVVEKMKISVDREYFRRQDA